MTGLTITTIASAQCLMREVPFAERVQNAAVIVEGKVISKQSFWNEKHDYIYTSNTIEVYKVFKGSVTASNIEIITEGGVVDGKAIIANPSLKLSKGQTGIFIIKENVTIRINSFKPYAGPQGFIQYDFSQNKAFDAFSVYVGITTNLYQKIKSLTGRGFTTLNTFDVNEQLQESGRAVPVISNFSPTTLSAGTRTLLTINGSNFGSTRGSGRVSFRNADLGGVAYTGVTQPLYYQSWSDTQIKIYVPGDVMASSVGTGNIQVTNNSSETGTSSTSLTIDFNRYEVIYAGEIIPTILYDDNGSGGYTFHAHTEIAALPAATSAIIRALSTWNCADQINWNVSSTPTTTDVTTSDGINVIRFDNGTEMSSGTLGYGSSYWGLYSNGVQKYWVLTETDITMDDGTNWNYGPGNPTSSQYDFESVLLHELGHIHQFNHSGNNSSPMYYGIANGVTDRNLLSSDMTGGVNVCNASVVGANDLGMSPMNLFYGGSCTTGLSPITFENSEAGIYPNPATDYITFNINKATDNSRIEVFNLLGVKCPVVIKEKKFLDVSFLKEGIYVLKISDSVSSEAFRFAVKR